MKNKNIEKSIKIALCRKKSCFQGPYKFILIAHAQNFEETLINKKDYHFRW